MKEPGRESAFPVTISLPAELKNVLKRNQGTLLNSWNFVNWLL